ncbi:hypothetical protein LTR15_009089 [Elasticomyces elasticus]|nr:hypothetical protein LTR15_009089 [Elasticomyces elasticus]
MTSTKPSLEADGVEVAASSKQTKMDYTDIITVLVGTEQCRFIVHKDALTIKSPFFNAACGREWIEGQEKIVRLPEQDAETFRVYLRWVYGDTLEMTLMKEPPGYAVTPSFLNLDKAWLLSSYLQDDMLCNMITDRTIEKFQLNKSGLMAMTTLQYVFDHTPSDSPIGRLFLDGFAAASSARWFAREGTDYPQAVLFDMAKRFAGGEQKQLPTMRQEDLRKEERGVAGMRACHGLRSGSMVKSK